VSTSPVTLDFSKAQPVDQGVSLDFSKAQKLEDDRVFLDKEIPLDSYTHATESGLQSIGRGFRGVGQGLKKMVTHPIEAADDTVNAIADLPSQIRQVPGAIHDINQSPDPTGTYLKVGQETAGQGAAQAATAAATEGIGKGIGPVVRAAKPITAKALTFASDIVDPDITGLVSPRLAHLQKVAGRVGRTMSKPGTAEQAAPLGKIPVSTAAEKTAAVAPRIARPATGIAPEAIPPIPDEVLEPESAAESEAPPSQAPRALRVGPDKEPFSAGRIQNAPDVLNNGESALRQVLTGQDNQALLKIAKSRGINVTKEAQLKPASADRLLVNKIVEDFSPEELDEVHGRYVENSRFRHGFGDIGPEAQKTLSLETFFPDLKIPAARQIRTRAAITNAPLRNEVPETAPIGDVAKAIKSAGATKAKTKIAAPAATDDLTSLLEKSVEKARKTKPSKVQK
jgi:hypothetical protein